MSVRWMCAIRLCSTSSLLCATLWLARVSCWSALGQLEPVSRHITQGSHSAPTCKGKSNHDSSGSCMMECMRRYEK